MHVMVTLTRILTADSFALLIKTKDLREDYRKLKEHFDFSNYPADDPLFSTERKSQVG